MNGGKKLTMTGSSNSRTEQLNWLSDVAATTSKGSLSKTQPTSDNTKTNINVPPILHKVGDNPSLLFTNAGSAFSPSLVVARPGESCTTLRMFTPPFQVERAHHVAQISGPPSGSGASLYYSQAPRTTPYSNFFQTTYPSSGTYQIASSQNIAKTVSANPPEPTRTYLQIDNYSTLAGISQGAQAVSTSPHAQISSSDYLHYPSSASSPTGLVLPSHSVQHNRLFQQGRSILISRSPEGIIIPSSDRESCHVKIHLSPTLQEESMLRKSCKSTESAKSCSPISENVQSGTSTLDFPICKEYITQNRTSPSHVGYRVPTGKEGSLKHRILRPPSINIVDPPPSAVAEAPLSAPPIRTCREPSPKQARSLPSSGYRSFSSSASSLTESSNRLHSVHTSPSTTIPNHNSSISSGSPSPAPPNSPGTAAQLKYPQSFMKGAIIQLANNQLKQVENLTTEDFIECGLLSPTLRIDSSTVVNIEKNPSSGAAKLSFHVGKDKIQITVEAPLEHPFFVYKQGWSSCSPERSAQRYGLSCHKLKVGDVCISLTDKPKSSNTTEIKTSPTVPIIQSNTPSSSKTLILEKPDDTSETKEISSQKISLPISTSLQKELNKSSEKTIEFEKETKIIGSRKRKRHWSAPDNISQKDI